MPVELFIFYWLLPSLLFCCALFKVESPYKRNDFRLLEMRQCYEISCSAINFM